MKLQDSLNVMELDVHDLIVKERVGFSINLGIKEKWEKRVVCKLSFFLVFPHGFKSEKEKKCTRALVWISVLKINTFLYGFYITWQRKLVFLLWM